MSKILKSTDKTLSRSTYTHWLFLIDQYQLTKAKKHPRFKFVSEFYKCFNLKRQNFNKYYNRFKLHPVSASLLPQKRGPRYLIKRTPHFIENKVLELRANGLSKFEIFHILKPKFKQFPPSCSTIYNIAKRHNLNKLKPKEKAIRRSIIKKNAGELAHIDCHYLPKGMVERDNNRYYIVAIIDAASRIAWAKVVKDIKSITVMFATLRMLNIVKHRYDIEFKEMLSDNGSEFGHGSNSKNKDHHPFEILLKELEIKHRYTKPYRPQTNGKVERFWRTIQADLLEDMVFDSFEHLKEELEKYIFYYNELRPNSALNGLAPKIFLDSCQRIS